MGTSLKEVQYKKGRINMSKGSWDRSNPIKVQESEYWKPENVAKRKMIATAFSEGWRDIHGGDHGAYWRGINPATGRCEKLPDRYTRLSQTK